MEQNVPNTSGTQGSAENGVAPTIIDLPPKGESVSVAVVPGASYQFDSDQVTFTQDGNNLVAHGADGGQVVLEDYFTFAGSELPPALSLENGAAIPADQILADVGNPDLNAAEPAAGGAAGGGAGGATFTPYAIDAIGTGLGVLDLLGNLDMTFSVPQAEDVVLPAESTNAGGVTAADDVATIEPLAIAHTHASSGDGVPDVSWSTAWYHDVSGNVITGNPTTHEGADSVGTEGATITYVDGTAIAADGTAIAGTYGDLVMHSDGSATYTAHSVSSDGSDFVGTDVYQDSFTYTLAQADGDSDTATLTVNLSANLSVLKAAGLDVYDAADHRGDDTYDHVVDLHDLGHTAYVFGTSGADHLIGGTGNDYLNGGAGDDVLAGNEGNDHLIGAAGADHLYGGAGNDVLTGGAGADTFYYTSADAGTITDGNSATTDHDTITDFQVGTDHIDLDAMFSALGAGDVEIKVTGVDSSGTAVDSGVSADTFTVTLVDATTHATVDSDFSITLHTTTSDTATDLAQALLTTHTGLAPTT